MRYFVLWPDGQKFGPADGTTLSQWAWEGRIGPETTVEEEGTGRHLRAGDLPDIEFPRQAAEAASQSQASTVQDPYTGFGVPEEFPLTSGSPYPIAASQGKAKSDVNTAWGLIVGGLVSSVCAVCCVVPVPLALTGAGIYYANRAKKAGEPGADTAQTVGIIVIVLQVVAIAAIYIVRFAAMASAFGGRSFP